MIIQINKNNQNAILSLNKEIYNLDSIKISCLEFKEFFSHNIQDSQHYHKLFIEFSEEKTDQEYKIVCLEFFNYTFQLMKNKNQI